jgi:hypothetical protein
MSDTFDNKQEPLPLELPDELKSVAKYLWETLGVKEYGWSYPEIIQVLKILSENEYVILGGDVITTKADRLKHTYDSWYYNVDPTLKKDTNINASLNKAVEYIQWYQQKLGEGFLYVPVYRPYHRSKLIPGEEQPGARIYFKY